VQQEKLQILKMLEDGKITAEEASRLLAAVDDPVATASGGGAKWFRVRVLDIDTGKAKVNVNLPIALVEAGLDFGLKFVPDGVMRGNVDIRQIVDAIKHGAVGKLVEVEDEDEAIRVEIVVE